MSTRVATKASAAAAAAAIHLVRDRSSAPISETRRPLPVRKAPKSKRPSRGQQLDPTPMASSSDYREGEPVSRADFTILLNQVAELSGNVQRLLHSATTATTSPPHASTSAPQGDDGGSSLSSEGEDHVAPQCRRPPQEEVEDVLDAFATDSGEEDAPLPAASNRPLGATIDPIIKSCIWSDKLVCLPTLLGRKTTADRFTMGFDATSARFTLKQPTNHTISFPDWLDAFDIYLAVACTKNPALLSPMMSHKSRVKELYVAEGSSSTWHWYDLEYRKTVASPDKLLNKMGRH